MAANCSAVKPFSSGDDESGSRLQYIAVRSMVWQAARVRRAKTFSVY